MTVLRACALALLACGVLATLLPAPAAAAPELITLENKELKVVFLTTGATIQKLFVPDCKNPGKQIDVALGCGWRRCGGRAAPHQQACMHCGQGCGAEPACSRQQQQQRPRRGFHAAA